MYSSHDSLAVNVTMDKCIEQLFPLAREEQIEEEKAAEAKAKAERGDAEQLATLPIFVLDSLLPRQTMTLNVFEPRYLLMIERCLQGGRRFGMMGYFRTRHHGHSPHLAEHGTEAEITEAERQPDGRYIVKIVGRRCFRVNERWSQDDYVMARVQWTNLSLPPTVALEQSRSAAEQLRGNVAVWQALVRSGGWERAPSQLDEVLEQLGAMPAATAPDDLALWVGALINPLPGLGVAPEIRPHLLAADSSHNRVAVALSGIKSSIRYMSPGRMWDWINKAGFQISQPAVRNIQGAIPWMVIVSAIAIRLVFYGDDEESDTADANAASLSDGVSAAVEAIAAAAVGAGDAGGVGLDDGVLPGAAAGQSPFLEL